VRDLRVLALLRHRDAVAEREEAVLADDERLPGEHRHVDEALAVAIDDEAVLLLVLRERDEVHQAARVARVHGEIARARDEESAEAPRRSARHPGAGLDQREAAG